eukprot:COSAG05_NODE_1498_length_4705_cov_11.449197_3_plen_85_part_00
MYVCMYVCMYVRMYVRMYQRAVLDTVFRSSRKWGGSSKAQEDCVVRLAPHGAESEESKEQLTPAQQCFVILERGGDILQGFVRD